MSRFLECRCSFHRQSVPTRDHDLATNDALEEMIPDYRGWLRGDVDESDGVTQSRTLAEFRRLRKKYGALAADERNSDGCP